MPKLTNVQTHILTRASRHATGIALPLPNRLKGAAAKTSVSPLLKRGLLSEAPTDPRKCEALWDQNADGTFTTLIITDAGLAAIGVEIDPPRLKPVSDPAPANPAQRKGTKQAMLIKMLRTKDGATLDEIVAETGWLKHTARGVISGQLKKRLGLTVLCKTVEGRGRIYQIVP